MTMIDSLKSCNWIIDVGMEIHSRISNQNNENGSILAGLRNIQDKYWTTKVINWYNYRYDANFRKRRALCAAKVQNVKKKRVQNGII